MIKRTLKRSLSIFLTLVLLATTFFIFDPSVLKMDANAWLEVEDLEESGRPEVKFLVPETIYLASKASSSTTSAFEYYVDSDVTGGLSVDPQKTTGQIYFESSAACSSITITPTAETGTVSSINFRLDGASSNTITCDVTNKSSLNAQIVSGVGSSGAVIKWTATYTTAAGTFYSYAYTYVYRVAEQAVGTVNATSGNVMGTTNNATAYSMATGFHSIGTGQAYSSALTGIYNPLNIPIGSDALGSISTSGDGNTYLGSIPFKKTGFRDDNNITDEKLSPIITHTAGGVYWAGYRDGTQNWTQSTESTWPTASITIDKSRYSNTNQLPFLQIVEYWSRLDYEEDINSELSYSFDKTNYTASVTTTKRGKSNSSDGHVRYTSARINSPVQSSSYTLYLKHKMHYDTTNLGDHVRNSTSYKKISVTVVDKAGLRASYRLGCNNSYKDTEVASYAADIANLKTMGTNLGNPTSTTTTTYTTPQLPSLGDKKVNTPKITFYVPETIYLTPSTGNTNTFKYYVDRANSEGGSLRTGEQTSGNVYFNCPADTTEGTPAATSVSISCSGATVNDVVAGSAIFTGTSSVSDSIASGTLSTAIAANNYSTITWTATYVVDGVTYTAKNYSKVYAPYLGTVAMEVARKRCGTWVSAGDRAMANGTLWVTGIHSMTANGGGTGDFQGAFPHNPLTESCAKGSTSGVTGVATTTSCEDNNKDPRSADFSYTSGSGWIGYWQKSEDSGTSTYKSNYNADITVDNSRYSNLNQVPNLCVGLDIQEQRDAQKKQNGTLYIKAGSTSVLSKTSGSPNNKQNWQGYRFCFPINSGLSSVLLEGEITARVATVRPQVQLNVTSVSKSALRNAINAELSVGRQSGWYTEGWSTYESKLKTAIETLGNLTATASAVESARSGITDGVAALKNTTQRTALAHHKSNASGNKLLQDEQIAYYTGDTVTAGANTYTGYTYASVSAPTGATNANPSVARNTSNTALEWTFWYTPKTYNVVYKKNDATGGITADTTKNATYDATFTVGSGVGTPTKDGSTFAGWEFSGNGVTYQINDTLTWQYDSSSLYFTPTWTGNKYNVAFNVNNGTGSIATMEGLEYGKTYNLPTVTGSNPTANVTREGYNFAGWARSSNATSAEFTDGATFSNLTPNNDVTVTLFAVWTPKRYTVTLHAMTEKLDGTLEESTTGGTVSGAGTQNYSTALSISKTAKTGFVAASSWYTSSSCTTAATVPATVTRDLEFWAKFTREKYTINFNYNYTGQTTPYRTLTNVKFGSSQAVPNPTRTGYGFVGWYKEAACTNAIDFTATGFTVGDLGNDGATINYYAKWTANTITVAYNAGSGSGTAPANDTFSYGASYTTKGAGTFTAPTGYKVTFNGNGGSCATTSITSTKSFDKWKSSANNATYAASTATSDNLGATSGTVTLTAQWKPNAITLPGATKTGYTFDGWYTLSSGGNRVGGTNSNYTPTAAITLYAQFTAINYTITLSPYYNTITNLATYSQGTTGGTVSGAGTNFHYGDTLSISASPATGYKFDGWFTNDSLTTATNVPSTMPAENKTFYAKFSVDYCTVTASAYYNTAANQTAWAAGATGGTVKVAASAAGTAGATSSGKVVKGTSATLTTSDQAGTVGVTSETGYHFVGWYSTVTGGNGNAVTAWGTTATNTVSYPSNNTTMGGTTVNRYARFDINTSTLKVNPNDGTWNGFTTEQTYTKAYGQTLSVPVPTRTGYTFAGWNKSSAFYGNLSSTTAAATYTFPADYNATSTITASWTGINYTITYKYADGTPKSGGNYPASATFGTAFNVSAPTKTGYTFTGWTVTSGLDTSTAKWGTTNAPATAISATTKCANGAAGDVYFKDLRSTTGAVELTATWLVNNYKLDLNGKLDGTAGGNITGYGKADVYVNGILKGNQVTDFYQDVPYGVSYEIKNITADPGHYYVGVSSGSLTGTMPANNVSVQLEFKTEQYNIKMYRNYTSSDETLTNDFTVAYGATKSNLVIPTRTGYDFAGWYDARTGGTKKYDSGVTSITFDADLGNNNETVSYYAQWTVHTHNVILHVLTDGTASTTGGTVSGAGTYNYDAALSISATPNTGYTFDAWYTSSDVSGTAADVPTKMGDADIELWANFEIIKNRLTVYAYSNSGKETNYYNNTTGGTVKINSGTAGASATDNINYGSTATIIAAKAATGYQFDGWYSTVTGGSGNTVTGWGTQFSTSASVESASMTVARTYYAKFSAKAFTIKFDPNGGTNGATTSITAYYNGTASLSAAAPTKPAADLIGWSKVPTDTESFDYANDATLSVEQVNRLYETATDGEITLYAVWHEYVYNTVVLAASNTGDNTTQYAVNTTGGTAALNGVTTIKYDDIIRDKITVTPKTGYEFTEIRYGKVTSAPTGNLASDWGIYSTRTTPKMPQFEDEDTVAFIAYFSVKQYEADAYAMSASGSTFVQNAAGGTVKVSGGVGGATATANIYFGNTTGVTFEAVANTGYEFKGWYKDAALTTLDTSDASVQVLAKADTVPASGNQIKRWAKFTIGEYDAYVRANFYEDGADKVYTEGYLKATGTNGITGGTASVGIVTGETTTNPTSTTSSAAAVSVSAKYSESVRYTATPATGYDFAGWYYSEDTDPDTATDAVDITTEYALETLPTFEIVMPDEDVRLVAKFIPKNFILVLDPNGGISGPTAAVTLTYNQAVTLDSTAKATKSGSTFLGWAETNTATSAAYNHTDATCTMDVATVNRWFTSRNTGSNSFTIYAVWQIATYVVTLDNQGATDGITSVNVILNNPMPTIASEDLPTYAGYNFKGYYTEPGGKGTQYYNADGTSAKAWNIADDGTLYALWTCPVLTNADYNENTGKWVYTYETTDGTVEKTSDSELLTPQELTELAGGDAKEISSIDRTEPANVVNKNKEAADIDLNDYDQGALTELLKNVTKTNTDEKRGALSQPELNAYVSKVSYNLDLAITDNRNTSEKVKPSIKIYETESKLNSVKQKSIIDPAKSATGVTYEDYPKTTEASNFIYAGKQSEVLQEPVDYMIFTNSRTPVIALEIDDGEVGTTVSNNTASYPTNVTVSPYFDTDKNIVKGTAASDDKTFTTGAVEATNNISEAWFKPYVDAGIGVGNGTEPSKKAHDYNAKTILYLTPEFTSDRVESTTDEIIYTITPYDDAYVENTGLTKAEIANVPTAQAGYRAFSEDNKPKNTESITVCISYHNSMNGTSDEGGDGGYLQADIDQPTNKNQYGDIWIDQMHIFRTAGGVSNWELPLISEEVYPVDDMTYRNTGYVFGSFAYVFDSTNEPVAASYAEAGNYTAAKEAIISSVKATASEKIAAIGDYSNANHLNDSGLGLFEITGWSRNYYPKKGSYVYVHLVDRWGNVFNRVWKNFNVDDIKVAISGNVTNGFKLDEKGGSNIDYIKLDGVEIDFITDLDSSYENESFVTTENTFIVVTDKPASKIPMEVYDYAGNKLSGKIPTNTDGSIKFTVTDECADLSRGAYTFDLNDSEVNLWACDPALVRKTEMASSSIVGEPTVFTITTMDRAKKVQLVENGMTRTYTPDMSNVDVVENGDGTLTWTIRVNPLTLGEHTFEVKCKDNSGWNDSGITLTTNVISKPAEKPDIKLSMEDTTCEKGERAVLRVSTNEGTEFVRVMYDNGYSTTVSRSDDVIVSCVDDIEVWSIAAGAFKDAGEYTASAYIQYNGKWQRDNTVTSTVTVKEPAKEAAEIFAVTILDKEINAGEKAAIEVLTSKATDKIQFVLPSDTYTVSAANAQITDNGDGTLTWTVEKAFSTTGANDIILKSRSSAGWTESKSYGIVLVK